MNHIIKKFTTNHLIAAIAGCIGGIISTPYWKYSSCITFLFLCLTYTKKNRLIFFTIFSLFFFAGLTRYYQQKEAYFSDLYFLQKPSTIQGTIVSVDQAESHGPSSTKIKITVDTIDYNNTTYSVNKDIYIFVPSWQKIWVIPYQKIKIENITLTHPKNSSYQSYLIKEKIWAVAHQQYFRYTTIKKPHEFFIWTNKICNKPFNKLSSNLSEKAYSLYLSIFCGKKIKSPESFQLKSLFQYWGLSHYLARSGLHLVLLLWMLWYLFSYIACRAMIKEVIMSTIIFIYYLTTFPSVAFLRSLCMYFAYVACKLLAIPINALHILSLITLTILLNNPYYIFFLDFQLSFSITFLILWFFSQLEKLKTVAS